MQWLWTWKGKSLGYRQGDDLRLRAGTHVGTFVSDEIYDFDGNYIGEVRNGNRLIARKASRSKRAPRSRQKMQKVGVVGRVGLVGLVGIVGYENFPNPDSFR